MIATTVSLLLIQIVAQGALGEAPQPVVPQASTAWVAPQDPAVAPPVPRREFRGLWVASVANIDWPVRPAMPVEELRRDMHRILDAAAHANLNAILLQVRPACDALYPSPLEPWSEFLTGESGRPPAVPYDPLEEWIRAAHRRGLELHAWINPFRARHFESKRPDAPSHVSRTRPELVRSYDRYLWMDPGEPDAREHSLGVAMDLVQRYDLDGLHFDDYFYPYPKDKQPFPDEASFSAYAAAGGTLARDDWRRANIDGFVRDLYQRVKSQRPTVKVGISPFGIWRPGSPPQAKGFDAYDGLFADARAWTRAGWLDYVSPQLYWRIDAPAQPFVRLLDWWIDQNDHGRHVWPGLNVARILPPAGTEPAPGAAASWEPGEIVAQVEATRTARAGGTVMFSAKVLVENRRGLADALANGPFADRALPPASPWLARSSGGDTSRPAIAATDSARGVLLTLPEVPAARWWVLWSRRDGRWLMKTVASDAITTGSAAGTREIVLSDGEDAGGPDAVAAQWLDAAGIAGPVAVLVRPAPR